jgi:nitric oxide reductase large subunit
MGWFKSTWDWFFSYLTDLFEKHKFVRRTVVFVSLALIIYITITLMNEGVITIIAQSPHGTAYALLVGHIVTMLTALIGLYKWLRERNM